eukprot:7663803-Pyramimonas_sp.AAC.1
MSAMLQDYRVPFAIGDAAHPLHVAERADEKCLVCHVLGVRWLLARLADLGRMPFGNFKLVSMG